MNIEKMAPEHTEQLAALESLCFSSPWSKASLLAECENASAVFLVAAEGGRLLGYGGMHLVLGEGFVTNIAVFPAHRNRGVAKAIVAALFAQTDGFLSLEVRPSNTPAVSLYLSMGFKEEGRRKNFYQSPTEDALILTRY